MATITQPALPRVPKSPGVIYSVIAVSMVVLLGTLALSSRQPPPPTIAEFAPQAVEQITDAPSGQAGTSGGGGPGGECPPGQLVCDPSQTGSEGGLGGLPEEEPIDVPRVRKCVGQPPRQTEDPQSPPCVPYFSGDNGGATYKGVTANEVRVLTPANQTFAEPYANYFNSRYEFYGRKIKVVKDVSTGFGAPPPHQMVADAKKADEESKVFASTLYGDAGGQEYVFYDELARRGIVSMNGRPVMASESDFARFHPYQWSYLPGYDQMARSKAEWICKALKGRNAEFSGSYVAIERKFGMVTTVRPDGYKPNQTAMRSILSGCGIDLGDYDEEMVMDGNDQSGINQARGIVQKFQLGNVTSIICECHTQSSGFYMGPQASAQGYLPEWLIGTYMYQAEDTHANTWTADQVNHSFGHSWWDKQLRPQDSPWYTAIREGDRSTVFGSPYDYYEARWMFNSIRLLAAGIQMAGPRLTPDSFAQGLMREEFPNPGAGGPPFYQASVSFGPSDHSAIDDAALVWLTTTQNSNWFDRPGAKCYVRSGVRYRLGTWPSDNAGLYTPTACY